ncbi:MAG: hypothetical protein JWM28_2307 [Chitinophagaceae bacterium]|nr:hypothetical protein [Chitinophagaceae bacterium]
MKILFCLASLLLAVMSKQDCNKKKIVTDTLYKARLEIKGICMNYTIKVLEGNIDTSLIAPHWTDETTGKAYTHVFALGNPCSFPSAIQQGDEFLFRIDTAKNQHCTVCLAYYPKPSKHLSIICVDK